MKSSLETIYGSHHATRRGAGFVLLGDERGSFLHKMIGTGKRVLDIGCRDGALTKYFAEGNTVTGVDIDSEALARAAAQLSIATRQIDLNGAWGIEKNSFDVVVAAEILEHLYYPEKVVEKVAFVLTAEGIFVGSVPSAFSLRHRLRYVCGIKKNTPLEDPTHINHFTVKEFRDILKKHFETVQVIGYGRLGRVASLFPQLFAYGLLFCAKKPRRG